MHVSNLPPCNPAKVERTPICLLLRSIRNLSQSKVGHRSCLRFTCGGWVRPVHGDSHVWFVSHAEQACSCCSPWGLYSCRLVGERKHAKGLDMFMFHGGTLQHVLSCTAVTTLRLIYIYIYIAMRTVKWQDRRNYWVLWNSVIKWWDTERATGQRPLFSFTLCTMCTDYLLSPSHGFSLLHDLLIGTSVVRHSFGRQLLFLLTFRRTEPVLMSLRAL